MAHLFSHTSLFGSPQVRVPGSSVCVSVCTCVCVCVCSMQMVCCVRYTYQLVWLAARGSHLEQHRELVLYVLCDHVHKALAPPLGLHAVHLSANYVTVKTLLCSHEAYPHIQTHTNTPTHSHKHTHTHTMHVDTCDRPNLLDTGAMPAKSRCVHQASTVMDSGCKRITGKKGCHHTCSSTTRRQSTSREGCS